MSDLCREQYPLLRDDLSEEEHYSPHYHRRHRPLSCRSRARNNLKGAAAILTRWPEHWSTFLTYWWIGLGMICLTTFVIYNSLFAFSMLPPASLKPVKPRVMVNSVKQTSPKIPQLPEVFMHVFAEYNKEVDINKYLPYIEAISTEFMNFKYYFIIVFNDTVSDSSTLSDEQNNEVAFNSLWSKDKQNIGNNNMIKNVEVEYISLTKYMDNSPLRKHWRILPTQFIAFLLRAVSIWERGGIVFNPLILTPQSPHAAYNGKLKTILKKYQTTISNPSDKSLPNLVKPQKDINNKSKLKQKVNNIRDIIDALELEDGNSKFSDQILTEAENRNTGTVLHGGRKLLAASLNVTDNEPKMYSSDIVNIGKNIFNDSFSFTQINSSSNQENPNYNSSTHSLLPMFLEFLFHHNTNSATGTIPNIHNETSVTTDFISSKHVRDEPKKILGASDAQDTLKKKQHDVSYSSMIIPANKTHAELVKTKDINEFTTFSSQEHILNRLIIDLKGNVIATGTSCHAFLGTIFSNAIHHSEEETITDFIITESSLFCRGTLSSCVGIDLILL